MAKKKSKEHKTPEEAVSTSAHSDVIRRRELCNDCIKGTRQRRSRTTIHLIRSVKGGSGKTTYALHRAMDLAQTYGKNKCKVLYIDADVHASETMNMLVRQELLAGNDALRNSGENSFYFYRFSNNEQQSVSREEIERIQAHNLNTYMHSYMGYYSEIRSIVHSATIIKRSITTVEVSDSTDDDPIGKVDFIFSDNEKRGRSIFENMYQSSGKSVLGVGIYAAKMIDIINYSIDSGYTDVIIDMPPGSDTFSSHLAEIVIDLAEKKKCELEICYVVNDDYYHFNAAKTAILEHMHVMRSNSPCNLILVYNIGCDNNTAPAEKLPSDINRTYVINLLQKNRDDSPTELFELSRISVQVFRHDMFYYTSTRGAWINDANATPVFWPKSLIESV